MHDIEGFEHFLTPTPENLHALASLQEQQEHLLGVLAQEYPEIALNWGQHLTRAQVLLDTIGKTLDQYLQGTLPLAALENCLAENRLTFSTIASREEPTVMQVLQQRLDHLVERERVALRPPDDHRNESSLELPDFLRGWEQEPQQQGQPPSDFLRFWDEKCQQHEQHPPTAPEQKYGHDH